VFDLNFNIRAQVQIQMPQTLHDAVQKALIAEEELTSRGQGRTPTRSTGKTTSGRPTMSALGTQSTGLKTVCWTCGEPHYQQDRQVERDRGVGST
jgi:hypothetical protein